MYHAYVAFQQACVDFCIHQTHARVVYLFKRVMYDESEMTLKCFEIIFCKNIWRASITCLILIFTAGLRPFTLRTSICVCVGIIDGGSPWFRQESLGQSSHSAAPRKKLQAARHGGASLVHDGQSKTFTWHTHH